MPGGTVTIRIALALIAVVAALAMWSIQSRQTHEVGQAAALPPAPEVRAVTKVVERVKYVKVLPPEAKAKLGLSPDHIADASKKISATGTLAADERDYTLSAVLDTETGESEIYARPDPLPWIGRGRRGAVGIAYGLASGEPTARAYAYHDLLQVKALHAGVRADADQRGEWWAGGYVEYRW